MIYLEDKIYLGIVEKIDDPKKSGRLKIRVQGLFEEIPLEHIPWSSPRKSTSGKSFELPKAGNIVNVNFPNNNLYCPEYIYSENMNINLQDKLKDYSGEGYENFISLLFDDRTQIYSDLENLTMDYKFNKITIDEDSINLELKDNQQKINIGTEKSTQQAMLGNHWLDFFDNFIKTLQKPDSMIGNLGAPVLKPELDKVCAEYWQKRESFISDHVYITDDKKIKKLK
jgi:hypothetical protein